MNHFFRKSTTILPGSWTNFTTPINFVRPEPAFSDGSGKGKPEDIYHFVSYVPAHGRLYELDGLKAGTEFVLFHKLRL